MVIWLKKFSYSLFIKGIAVILFCTAAFGMLMSLIGMTELPKEESWYGSSAFMEQLTYKAGFVRDWIVRYADDEIFNPAYVTHEQIVNYKKQNGKVMYDQEAVERIIKDRQAYFEQIQQELVKDNVNVDYLAIDKASGRVITNIKDYTESGKETLKEAIKHADFYLIGDGTKILETKVTKHENQAAGNDVQYQNSNAVTYEFKTNYFNGKDFAGQENFEVYVAVAEPLSEGDWFYTAKQEFDRHLVIKDKVYTFGAISIVLALLMLLYWYKTVGQSEKNSAVKLTWFDKIPFEVQLAGYCLFIKIWLGIMSSRFRVAEGWLPYTFDEKFMVSDIQLFFTIGLAVCVSLLPFSSLIKHIKNHTMHLYIGVIRIIRWLYYNLITEKTLPIAAFLGISGYVAANLFFVFVTTVFRYMRVFYFLSIITMIGFNIGIGILLLKVVSDFVKVLKSSKQIAGGKLNEKIELHYALPVMSDMADTLNHIGEGLENAVENSLKSERLKTELITNVSHDLKTPLTSIISYIDLLKEEPIDNASAKEYIQILDERSSRLKQLVEDLLEASKAVTGNIKADLAPVELHQLVVQAVGEYTDRLEAAGLTVIMNNIEKVSVLADGRHMYRILDNLLSNVNKYAMPDTRVYVDVIRENNYGKLIIKNISKEYLNIDASELTKRFVRGDTSRSTDGSGLGLAIAESLVRLQNGIFHNSIDGDLFKVEIKIPVCS